MQPVKIFIFLFALPLLANPSFAQTILSTPKVNSVLYTGEGKKQPLVVGIGGSEGGNVWTAGRWKTTREQFIKKGYAFLAIGYFGAPGTPAILDRISVNAVHEAILLAAKQPGIDAKRITLIGGSRGGDLALLIASYYDDINNVVAIVPSHVVFPAHTADFSTSAWTYNNKELDFVPVNEQAVPSLMKGDLRGAFEAMLTDTVAEQKAIIHVEKIKGNILFISAGSDEVCPSTPMCDKMIARLKRSGFIYQSEHIVYPGTHSEPLKHFDRVFEFLDKYFPVPTLQINR